MKNTFYLLVIFLLGLAGCASIPKQAPMLSEELGLQLNRIQKSHLKLLHDYFDMKRARVDEFINKQWLPEFATQVFSDEEVNKVWNEIVSSGSKEDRLMFILKSAPKLQAKLDQKKNELLKPLDDLEKEIEYKIRNEYDIARGINNSLTSFLYSAVKVEEDRKRYLEMLGVTQEVIEKTINETDEIVSNLVTTGEKVNDKEKLAEQYIEKLKTLKDKINTNSNNQ